MQESQADISVQTITAAAATVPMVLVILNDVLIIQSQSQDG
jgi:hypothetical protein